VIRGGKYEGCKSGRLLVVSGPLWERQLGAERLYKKTCVGDSHGNSHGKVHANSMLVLLNSRMALGSEETPSTFISTVIFATEPANAQNIVIETHSRDLAVDNTDMEMGPLRSSEP